MNTYQVKSSIESITIFSNGGGMLERSSSFKLQAGVTELKLIDIPVSFIPETLKITLNSGKLLQFSTKKPTKLYITEQLNQESMAAKNVINSSANLGLRRPEIIKVAEEVINRDYLDELAEVTVTVEIESEKDVTLQYSYMVEDFRINWSPFITVEILDGSTAQIKCLLTIENNSSTSYESVPVKFAEFQIPKNQFETDELDISDDISVKSKSRSKSNSWSNQMIQNRQLL
jgi:hypothetical protein